MHIETPALSKLYNIIIVLVLEISVIRFLLTYSSRTISVLESVNLYLVGFIYLLCLQPFLFLTSGMRKSS